MSNNKKALVTAGDTRLAELKAEVDRLSLALEAARLELVRHMLSVGT